MTEKLPEDKEAMLAVIDHYLALPSEEKLLFRLGRLGRRGGALRSLDELEDPSMRQWLQAAMRDLVSETGGEIEKLITELGDLVYLTNVLKKCKLNIVCSFIIVEYLPVRVMRVWAIVLGGKNSK